MFGKIHQYETDQTALTWLHMSVSSECSVKTKWLCMVVSASLGRLESMYSKTSLKRRLSNRPKIGCQDQLSLNAGRKYCRMLQGEHSAKLSTFIKLPFVIKIFVLSIFEWPFYTAFTVPKFHELVHCFDIALTLLISNFSVDFPIDLWEGFLTVKLSPHLVIQRMIKHVPELLKCQVSVSIQHLKSKDIMEVFITANLKVFSFFLPIL